MLAMPDEQTQQQLLDLTEAVKDDYGRVDLSSMWRPYSRYLVTTAHPQHQLQQCALTANMRLCSLCMPTLHCLQMVPELHCNMRACFVMSVIACGDMLETWQCLL